MTYKKLQLNLLTQTGELINCVSCFPGQVSVFRAPSYAALEVYQRALAGVPGPERISIFLDDQNFIPTEHFFVGFGEQRESAHETVASSFLQIGLDVELFHRLCHSYGIEIEDSTRWLSLTKCEARRVRLLLATQTRGQVLVLNDPFEPMANQWRERFAELIAQFARQNKEIVLVTNLSNRPEAWIDNQTIARIQVGEEIQRTIGFGSTPSASNDMIHQLRAMMKEPQPSSLIAPAPESRQDEQEETDLKRDGHQGEQFEAYHSSALVGLCALLDKLHIPYNDATLQRRFALIQSSLSSPIIGGGIAASLILGAASFLFIGESPQPEAVSVARLDQSQSQLPPETGEAVEAQISDNDSLEQHKSSDKIDNKQPDVGPAKVLDEYPESIKSSILASFQGLGTALGTDGSGQKNLIVKSPAQEEEASDLLKLLATASDSGEGLPDAPPPSDSYSDNSYQNTVPSQPTQFGSEEEKREAIRKRFLEAIERAQAMRKQ